MQALAVMGWSATVVAERLGRHYRPVMKIRAGEKRRVQLSTHEAVATIFGELFMVRVEGAAGNRVRAVAKRNGWVGPLAWDDIDDPRERANVRGIA